MLVGWMVRQLVYSFQVDFLFSVKYIVVSSAELNSYGIRLRKKLQFKDKKRKFEIIFRECRRASSPEKKIKFVIPNL